MSLNGCQLPCVPKFSEGIATSVKQPFIKRIKRLLAVPWNYYVKKWLKRAYYTSLKMGGASPA